MNAKELGEQFAHPGVREELQNGLIVSQRFWGMTKRELFAAMAMQGFAADSSITAGPGRVVELAVEYADALLAELAKDQP